MRPSGRASSYRAVLSYIMCWELEDRDKRENSRSRRYQSLRGFRHVVVRNTYKTLVGEVHHPMHVHLLLARLTERDSYVIVITPYECRKLLAL